MDEKRQERVEQVGEQSEQQVENKGKVEIEGDVKTPVVEGEETAETADRLSEEGETEDAEGTPPVPGEVDDEGQSGQDSDETGDEVKEETAEEINVAELKARLAEQTALAESYYARLARMQADFENYRKRVQREQEEFWKFASEPLITALLPVLDNFERALAARHEDPVKVVEGIEMIYRQLKEIMEREGLSPIPAVGEKFDPTRHEAVMQEVSDEYPENTVIEELRRGYFLKGKVIRPAMVKVSRSSQ